MAKIRSRGGYLYLDYREESGKRHRDALGLKDTRENRKVAEVELKKIVYEIASGVYKEKLKREKIRDIKLKEGYDEFIKTKKKRSDSTIDHYDCAYNKLHSFTGNKTIASITSDIIDKLEDQMLAEGRSPNTVASYFNKLRYMFNYFIDCGYSKKNPFTYKKMKPKKIVVVPEKEMIQILEGLKGKNRKHYQVIFLLLATGFRVSELLNLDFKDIDLKKNLIAVNNTKCDRIDYFPVYPELREFIINEFPERVGKLFDYKSRHSLKFFERFLKDEEYNHYSLHTLRKTFISRLVNSGLPIADVMAIARHHDIKVTLAAYREIEFERMGHDISSVANMGTILGTRNRKALKLIKTNKK